MDTENYYYLILIILIFIKLGIVYIYNRIVDKKND